MYILLQPMLNGKIITWCIALDTTKLEKKINYILYNEACSPHETIGYMHIESCQCSHVSGDSNVHIFSRLFPGKIYKINEIPGQFGFESVCRLIM